jgi:SAM-dependent methyltransferase
VSNNYDLLFRAFETPVMQRIRREGYGEDIGQHSWVTAKELRADIQRLHLSSSSRLVDLGCGPCGPLTFVLDNVRCAGVGVDVSAAALDVGRARAVSMGIENLFATRQADLNATLPFETASFDVAISLDAVIHIRERAALFREVARILRPGGRFLFTDGGVVTGPISNEEMRRRTPHGFALFVPPGWNDKLLDDAALRVLEIEDRTANAMQNAQGRLTAVRAYRGDLEREITAAGVDTHIEFLETVAEVSRRHALSRIMYLAEKPART